MTLRMADTEDIVNKDNLDNYVSVLLGLRYIVNGLQDFVTEKLRIKQMEIQQKCTLGRCQLNCSRKFGKSFIKWCDTCKHWKLELHTLNRYSTHWANIKWNKLDSIDFPQSFEEMGKVFVKDLYSFRHGVLKDFSALLSLIRNSNLFNVNGQTIDEMLRIRNSDCAHNISVELHEQDKINCLNVFVRCLKIPEINCTKSGKNALHCIEALRLCQGLPENILQKQEGRRALIDILNEIHNGSIDQNIINSEGKLEERLQQITGLLNKRRKYYLCLGPSSKTIKLFFIQLYFFICLSYWYVSNPSAKESSKGCLSMQFKNDWTIDSLVDFNFYVENLHNQSTVSRDWLFGKIYEELATSEKGVILTAEMGYGKSSIVSNIVCADQSSDWYGIRKNVLAYHFCRYDSIRSTNAGYFIRNIASAIVNRYPELGNSILSDDTASDILFGLRCSEDPIPCLEKAILKPLQNKWKNYQFLFIIDALDECDSADKNNILQLLFKQIDNFPQNVKFILTSRNIEQVLSKFKGLNSIELSSFRNENENDVTEYIRKNIHLTNPQMNLLTKISRGNFLHVKLYLESCKKSRNFDFQNIPSSLEKIYQMNLERAFDIEPGLFEELMPIFEVLCTMTKPMTEKRIFEVANISPANRRKTERVIGNELGHFLIFSDGNLSLLHKSIADFLTCKSKKHLRFFVNKENGHTLFGAYFLKSPNISDSDIVDVVYHVAMSGNDEWKNVLINNYAKHMFNDTKLTFAFYLQQVVRDFNSYTTTNLLLKMTNMKHINDKDERNMSAAFIAASHGNEHALQCLLDNGADPYFKVYFSYKMNRIFVTDIVHKCKYIHFCGYNILHIASQNGHIRTVQMLTERYFELIFTRNDMDLTAFELAAENGHTEIAAYMLLKDKSLASLLSLHHAAVNGHSNIIKLLLQYGVKDTCLVCNGTFNWIPYSHGRRQQDHTIVVVYANLTIEENYSFYDDWYLITCDTALNAAVRNGHDKVVELLLAENTNTLNCTAYDGKTPIMTAVQYNQTNIFKYLLKFKVDLTTKCRNQVYSNELDMYRMGSSEQKRLSRERCADGISIMHLLVVHWNFEMLILLKSNVLVNWEEKDDDESTPLHYAFCHSNYRFILIAIELNLNFTVRSKNGSTPFHSAALCKSLVLKEFMLSDTKYKLTIPDVKDNNGLSILQYGSLLTYNDDHDDHECVMNIRGDFSTIFHVALESKHNLMNIDVYGRNFLHYSATNGNYFSLIMILNSKLSQEDIKILLYQKDIFGQTPMDELFASMPNRDMFEPFKLPINCEIDSIFYTTCETNLHKIMTPHETFFHLMTVYLKKGKLLNHWNITNYLMVSMHKRRLYPLLILKVYAEDEFQNALLMIPEIHSSIAEFEGPHIAQIVLICKNAIQCNGKVSPLHKIIQNDRGKFWLYSNKHFLSSAFDNLSARILDICVDNEGYNVLQRAAMGGNMIAVQYLIEKGMNVTVLSKNGDNLLYLAIVRTPVSEYSFVPLYYHNSTRIIIRQYILATDNVTQDYLKDEQENGTVEFAETLGYILNVLSELLNTKLAKLRDHLCQSRKEKLGLIHLAASKGFLQFLKKCKHLFGNSILTCGDSNNITPYYLAHIYNQDHVTEWMGSLGVHMVLPSPEVESFLLYNIVDNYKIRKRFHWSCRLHYSYRHMQVFRLVYKRCSKIDEQYVVLKNPYLSKISEQHWILSAMNMNHLLKGESKTYLQNFESCLKQFDITCSEKVSILLIGMKNDKLLLRYFERRLRKAIAFGLNDKIPIFQSLFKSRSIRPNYFESLSFFGLFEDKYRYIELLSVRSDIHSLWIDSCVDKLKRNGVNVKTKSRTFYEELSRDIILDISKLFLTFRKDLHDYTLYRKTFR